MDRSRPSSSTAPDTAGKPPRAHDAAPSPDLIRPRHAAPDAFEQNPLSAVPGRIAQAVVENPGDEARVREAMRIIIAEGVPLADAARRCQIAPSFLASWREKYLSLLNGETSVAPQPLFDEGRMDAAAGLVQIPGAAREQFAENWERLVELTRATPSTFRQHPVRVFLENSWMTSWLFHEGTLDRGVAAGAAVGVLVLALTATFFAAGHFYRTEAPVMEKVENLNDNIQRAAGVVTRFFAADSVEARKKLIRADGPARQLMEDYFRKHPLPADPGATLTMAIPGNKLYAMEFEVPSLNRKHLCVVVERNGALLMDWETSSLFQEEHLKEIRKLQPRTPVRVAARIAPETYYNYGFTEDRFTCYKLSYPGLELDFFAYAIRDSVVDQVLEALVKPDTGEAQSITAVLEIQYPEGDVPANQVQIVRVLHEDWVTP